MSLLSVIQNVTAELNLPQPTAVFSNPDPGVVQLLRLAQRDGDSMIRAYTWSILRQRFSFVCSGIGGGAPEPGVPPSDFQQFANNASIWNNSRFIRLIGPVDADVWQRMVILNAHPVPQVWRLLNGQLAIFPDNVGETISFEYSSANWITGAGGTALAWAADTDTALIPERVIELGVIYRWKKAKGLDYGADMQNYKEELENEIGSDRASTPTSLSRLHRGGLPGNYWPGLITGDSGGSGSGWDSGFGGGFG